MAPNVVARELRDPSVTAGNRVWAADITYLWTLEGWLYLAVVLDLGSRRVIGWCADRTLDQSLALRALERALTWRQPAPGLGAPLGPRRAVRVRRLSSSARSAWGDEQHERARGLLGQRGGGELLRHAGCRRAEAELGDAGRGGRRGRRIHCGMAAIPGVGTRRWGTAARSNTSSDYGLPNQCPQKRVNSNGSPAGIVASGEGIRASNGRRRTRRNTLPRHWPAPECFRGELPRGAWPEPPEVVPKKSRRVATAKHQCRVLSGRFGVIRAIAVPTSRGGENLGRPQALALPNVSAGVSCGSSPFAARRTAKELESGWPGKPNRPCFPEREPVVVDSMGATRMTPCRLT